MLIVLFVASGARLGVYLFYLPVSNQSRIKRADDRGHRRRSKSSSACCMLASPPWPGTGTCGRQPRNQSNDGSGVAASCTRVRRQIRLGAEGQSSHLGTAQHKKDFWSFCNFGIFSLQLYDQYQYIQYSINPEPGLEIFLITKCFFQAGPLFHM